MRLLPDQLEASAIDLVKKCIAGDLDWKARQDEKINPVGKRPRTSDGI